MKYFFLSITFMVVLIAANEDYSLIFSIPSMEIRFITTDNLGNTYSISKNQLNLYDRSGKQLYNYSENNSGELKTIDASNPMKILLFYKDFAKIVILNSRLAEQSVLNLRSMDFEQPLAVCNSNLGGYWIYDRQDDQLKKIDINLKTVAQSGNLTQSLGYLIQPSFMLENEGMVYINNPETGILVFDQFGTYFKTLPFTNVMSFQIVGKDVLMVCGNQLLRYNSTSVRQNEIPLPAHDSILTARIEQHQLYLLTTTTMNFYSF